MIKQHLKENVQKPHQQNKYVNLAHHKNKEKRSKEYCQTIFQKLNSSLLLFSYLTHTQVFTPFEYSYRPEFRKEMILISMYIIADYPKEKND